MYNTLTWKDATGTAVTDPTKVGSGTYSACYTRTAGNTECNTACLDEVCTDVTVVCTLSPVELLSFEVQSNRTDATLRWQTATELNNSHFDIERSLDGINWRPIGQVDGHINSSSLKSYSYVDKLIGNSTSIAYYRLKQVDFDGQFSYSPERVVGFAKDDAVVNIFPNPVQNILYLKVENDIETQVEIYNIFGAIVHRSDKQIIDVGDLAQGTYVVRVLSKDGFELKKQQIAVIK